MFETRRARRHLCHEALECELKGRVLYAMLQDVSLLGGRLRGMQLPEVGTLLRVAPSFPTSVGRTWIYCQIAWKSRNGEVEEAGIRFMEPALRLRKSWVGQLIPESDPSEKRRSIRLPSEVFVEVKMLGCKAMEGTSIDLSQGGAHLQLPRTLNEGAFANVFVCLPWALLEMPAQVVRQTNPDEKQQSLKFLDMSMQDRSALNSFIREELPQKIKYPEPTGMSFLKVLNS